MTKYCLKHLHPDSLPLILRSKPQIKLFKHLCAAFSLGLSPCLTKLSTREQITVKFRSVGRAGNLFARTCATPKRSPVWRRNKYSIFLEEG